MRIWGITGLYYNTGISEHGIGAYKRQNSNELIIGTGNLATCFSNKSGDPVNSVKGYYKLVVRKY